TEILVAVAAGELEVAFDPGDHQQLLEDLRRLRQCEEAPRSETRRDEEVARALRSGLDERRRFDLEEAALGEVIADEPDDLVPEADGLGRLGAAEVKVPVAQAELLINLHRLVDV